VEQIRLTSAARMRAHAWAAVDGETSEVNRSHKVLEDAGVKLAIVATDVMGVSGREMMRALIEGVADPQVLADLAKARLRAKLPHLRKALTARFRAGRPHPERRPTLDQRRANRCVGGDEGLRSSHNGLPRDHEPPFVQPMGPDRDPPD
jgi:hypothetical protein